MSLKSTQQQFSQDILGGGLDALRPHIDSPIADVDQAFNVYVETIHLSLLAAVKSMYPTVFSQLDEGQQKRFFKDFFVGAQDQSRTLSNYGLTFPDFIEDENLKQLALFDLARYQASMQVWQAPLSLSEVDPDTFLDQIFSFQSWVLILAFSNVVKEILAAETNYCLISRQETDVTVSWISESTFQALQQLKSGASLSSIESDFDLNELVAILFNRNIIIRD